MQSIETVAILALNPALTSSTQLQITAQPTLATPERAPGSRLTCWGTRQRQTGPEQHQADLSATCPAGQFSRVRSGEQEMSKVSRGGRNGQILALWGGKGMSGDVRRAGLCLEHEGATLGMEKAQNWLGPAVCQALCWAFGINHRRRLSTKGGWEGWEIQLTELDDSGEQGEELN